MSVIIEIDAPQLLPHLVSWLRAADCCVAPISSHACRVVHREAETAAQALYELRFAARAWAGLHGAVGVHLRPAA